MRKNNETRLGGILRRAPERVCDTSECSETVIGGQSYHPSGQYLLLDYNAGLYITGLDGTAFYSRDPEQGLPFATEEDARAYGEKYWEVYRRAYLIEVWPASEEPWL